MIGRRGLLTGLGVAAFAYGAACADLALRARSAYREGEKRLEWHRRPELQKAHYDAELAAREKALRAEADAGRLSPRLLEQKLMLARFERDEAVAESSAKHAYVWFQSAAELFSPPETRWSASARERMKEARELWKKELDAKRIPYHDYMLE